MESWRKELYHHGIKGQKWGVRRGPPYPLNQSARSTAEKRYTSGSSTLAQLRDAYATRNNYPLIGGFGGVKSSITSEATAIAAKYGFSTISSPQTFIKDVKRTNPGYYKHLDDDRWLNNCTHSCVAFAARRRGLNVEAAPMIKEEGEQGGLTVTELCNRYFKGTFRFYENFQFTDLRDVPRTGRDYEEKASSELGKFYKDVPDGGYGMVQMQTTYGGHVFVWYKERGKIKFADSQAAMDARLNFNNIARYGVPCIASIRFDNLEFDPSRITEAIQSPSSELHHAITFFGGNFKMESWRQELYHHGIKGMKWGVRRTPEQLGHRRIRKAGSLKPSADDKKKTEMREASKNRRLLSTDEIRSRIDRIRLERQLKDLTDEELTPGRKFVKDVLSSSGRKVATTVATGVALYAVKAAITGKINPKELGEAAFNGGPKKK